MNPREYFATKTENLSSISSRIQTESSKLSADTFIPNKFSTSKMFAKKPSGGRISPRSKWL